MVRFLMRKVFSKNLTSELTEIKINENGFSLHEPFGIKPKLYDWKSIKNVYFSENNTEVIVQNLVKKIILKNNNIGWYEFIQNVPSEFINFNFQYVTLFIDALIPCDVCGIVAVNETECLVCKNATWNSKMAQSKIEYIRLQQLNLFSVLIKEGSEINNQAEPEHGFKANKNWKLYL